MTIVHLVAFWKIQRLYRVRNHDHPGSEIQPKIAATEDQTDSQKIDDIKNLINIGQRRWSLRNVQIRNSFSRAVALLSQQGRTE